MATTAARTDQDPLPAHPDDAWFFTTLTSDKPFTLNFDHGAELDVTNLWINTVIVHQGHDTSDAIAGHIAEVFAHEVKRGRLPREPAAAAVGRRLPTAPSRCSSTWRRTAP